jgi:hypothetical protein
MRRALLLSALLGCGKAYVNPVSIDAKAEPAAVMLLFDKSGSMASPLNPGGICSCAFPGCNEAVCPTRLGTVSAWTNDLLQKLGAQARWGLTTFPADNVCSPASANQVLTAIAQTTGAGNIAEQVQMLTPGGGTPTGPSLTFAGQAFPASTAERIVVLITDGLPNCNPQNPNTCVVPAACMCTLNGGMCGTVVNDGDPNNFCRRGCLDDTGTLAAIDSLSRFGIVTLVVGFGSDFGEPSASVANAMAQAGLNGERCASDVDCFGYACGDAGTCIGGALLARDGGELGAATETLRKKLTLSSRCRWTLAVDLPAGPSDIYFGTTAVPKSDWVAESTTRVRFFGDSCRRLIDEALTPTFHGQP